MAATENVITAGPVENAARPKRVRTGCLTCRERHLKCDEGLPDCQNCKKSSRECKRGVRLNFIDTQVKTPPYTPPTQEWDVNFLDESREIASEYKGGSERYAALVQDSIEMAPVKIESNFDYSGTMDAPVMAHQQLPGSHTLPPSGNSGYQSSQHHLSDIGQDPNHPSANPASTFSPETIRQTSHPTYGNSDQPMTPPHDPAAPLISSEEVLFMQVFVEEVGLWMDSMDPYKHVRYVL